jgi:diguanylate cyclase (GGDEF)-like protein
MHPTHPEDRSALAFAIRLLATVALTLALISLAGYLLLAGTLGADQISGASLHELRVALLLIALLAPIGGTAVFCLLGGGRLMREHRLVLGTATRDRLTELPNRRAFDDEFPDAVAAAMRYEEALTLILLDVDDLELIRHRHGRAEGDTSLRVASGVMRSARPSDRPYRITENGFALVVARTDAEGAHTLVRRLDRNFAQAGVTVSIGASALRPGQSAQTLWAEAQTALYVARRQGGGQAVQFDQLQALEPPADSVMLVSSEAPAAGAEL